MYVKNIKIPDEEIPEKVRFVWTLLSDKYKYTARITNIWPMLAESYGIKEFELLDYNSIQNGTFEGFLIDKLIEWQRGEDVDFSEIAKAVLEAGDFTASEKYLLTAGEDELEMRLWAIYLSVSRPNYY